MTEHRCTKETEIELIKQQNIYMREKVDEIHKILVGNGKPGIVTEMNEIRGGLKFTQIIFGVIMAILSLVLAIK